MSTHSFKKNSKKRKKFPISANLRALRKLKQITLKQLSDAVSINYESFRNYEEGDHTPPYEILIRIANYFGITLDFLLLWKKAKWPYSFKLLKLGSKIDKLDKVKRFQIESTVDSLLNDLNNNIEIKLDLFDLNLTKNIKKNINLVRKERKITQTKLAKLLDVTRVSIYLYENKSPPPVDKIVKISEFLDVSVHALVTGEKLFFKFKNQDLQEVLLKGDKLLPLEDKQFCIKLMEKIIADS